MEMGRAAPPPRLPEQMRAAWGGSATWSSRSSRLPGEPLRGRTCLTSPGIDCTE